MSAPSRRFSDSRPLSKASSASDALPASRPSSVRNGGALTVPTSPSMPNVMPGQVASPTLPSSLPASASLRAVSPAPSTEVFRRDNGYMNSPRKNGRRRYTPRYIPPSSFRSTDFPSSPSMAPPRQDAKEADVAQFIALTQQLNGQMDGLVDYHLTGGTWERYSPSLCG
jgi:hypothetical protein